jgi:hypothetical protein
MQRAVGELRHLGQFGLPGRGEGATVGLDPMGLAHHAQRWRNVLLHRPDQPHAAFDLAIIEHDAGGGICTAARPERSLTSSFARGSDSSASAASSVTG